MKIPQIIELDEENSTILIETLMVSSPNEGCALLIGEENYERQNGIEKLYLNIHTIWPCCNVWERGMFADVAIETKNQINKSKRTRFAIDPKENLLAQKWARYHKLKLLGSAHSHLNTDAIPSKLDLSLNRCSTLMVIVDSVGLIRAWWITKDQKCQELPVKLKLKQN